MEFRRAVQLYRELLDAYPSFSKAPRARARAEDLEAHAEGDFGPLTRLETVRRDPALASSPEAIASLERDAESFPAGRVRAEARLLCGGAWLGRLGDPPRAIRPLSALLRDETADPLLRRLALGQLVDARRATGDLAAAVDDVNAFPELFPALRDTVLREARRVWIRWGAVSLVALVFAVGSFAWLRLARASGLKNAARIVFRPLALAYAAWLALIGAALARGYDASDPTPFLLLGAGIVVIDAAARAWSAASLRALITRIPPSLRAALCIAAVLATAFLALDASDVAYLDSFGL